MKRTALTYTGMISLLAAWVWMPGCSQSSKPEGASFISLTRSSEETPAPATPVTPTPVKDPPPVAAPEPEIPWLAAADIKKLAETADLTPNKAADLLQGITTGLAAANIKPSSRARAFDDKSRAVVNKLVSAAGPAQLPAAIAALWWKEPEAQKFLRATAADAKAELKPRSLALRALGENGDESAVKLLSALLADPQTSTELRKVSVEVLGAMDDPSAYKALLEQYSTLPADLKIMTISGLTRTEASAMALLKDIADQKIPKTMLSTTNILQLQSLGSTELTNKVSAIWGSVKAERNPARVEVIKKMREVVEKNQGDAKKGYKVFQKNCMVCHIIYGKGNDIGPDLTGVGRENIDAILNNVLDPNLIVGDVYLVHMVKTKSGRVVTGVLAQDSKTKIVLKQAGGVMETILKDDVAKHLTQPISLMPEGLEKNITEPEFCDLVEFLLSTEPPEEAP